MAGFIADSIELVIVLEPHQHKRPVSSFIFYKVMIYCCEIRGPINLNTKWRTFKGSDIFIKTKPDECVHANLMRLLIWRVNMATNGCCDLS